MFSPQRLYRPCKAFFICYYHIACSCVTVNNEDILVFVTPCNYADVRVIGI